MESLEQDFSAVLCVEVHKGDDIRENDIRENDKYKVLIIILMK